MPLMTLDFCIEQFHSNQLVKKMRSSVDKQARYRPIQYPLVTAYGTGDPRTTENSLIITVGTKRLHLICCVIKFPGISGYYSAEKIGGFTTMA